MGIQKSREGRILCFLRSLEEDSQTWLLYRVEMGTRVTVAEWAVTPVVAGGSRV